MKKFIHILALTSLLVLTGCSSTKSYKSTFGFSTEVKDDWFVVSKQTLKEDPDLFQDKRFKRLRDEVAQTLKVIVPEGEVEVIFDVSPYTGESGFSANINIAPDEHIDFSKGSDKALCKGFKMGMSDRYGKDSPVRLRQCKFKKVGKTMTWITQMDGFIEGVMSTGYAFNVGGGSAQITGTCDKSVCPSLIGDIETMIEEIELED